MSSSPQFTRFLQRFQYSQQIYLNTIEQQSTFDIITELGDLRKFSLNSFMTFLAILTAPKALQPVALMLLLYTNNLRLSNTFPLHNNFTLSGVLHLIPVLVVSCMAYVQLASTIRSPALSVVALFVGGLPLVTAATRLGGQLVRVIAEASAPTLPVRMHDVVVPTALSSTERGQANRN